MKYLSAFKNANLSLSRFRRAMPCLCLTLFICFAICLSPASAERLTIEATGTYTIGDGLDENISVAKDRAKTDAMRNASEQASVFVESLSVVQEGCSPRMKSR